MNVLMTSAGRRSYMVEYFKQAVGWDGRVYAANSKLSPALKAADGYMITPYIYSDGYIPFLLDACKELKIGLLVSLFDIDMPVLARHRAEFEAAGVKLAMSESAFYEICSDKYLMGQKLSEQGIGTARGYIDKALVLQDIESGQLRFPLIVKPRFGMGSVGVYKVYNLTELEGTYSMCGRELNESYLRYESESVPAREAVLIQEALGGTEYGLDIICDLDGRYVNTIVRRKYAMRSGETDEAEILGEDDAGYSEIMALGERFAKVFKPRGLTDVDLIMGEDMAPRIIDINGRFGGGYPFSHIAGADVPRAYVLWAKGLRDEADACCKAEPHVRGYKDIVPRKLS